MATSGSPKVILASLTLQIALGKAFPRFTANFPLKIIQPQPALTTTNRFYKAYPGFEYNVRMAVIGGLYPFTHELTTAPSGMTINAFTGEISWPNPAASGTAYSVSAKVTDAEGSIQTVDWTVLVTTSGFIFVDAVNGTANTAGGTGTIGNPWKTLKDVYGGDTYSAMGANHRSGEFVYWRAGTYQMDAYIEDNGNDGLETPIRGTTKPLVWLGYPGDTKPVFNMMDAHLYFDGSGSNVYLDSLDIRAPNVRAMGLKIASQKQNMVIRRNKLSGITGGFQGGNNALLFINRWGTGNNYAIQDNEFISVNEGYGILNYNTRYVLVEDNLFQDIGSHCVGMKVRSEDWAVRSNRFRNNALQSIELHYNNNSATEFSGNIEISYNVMEAGGGEVNVNQSYEAIGYPVYIFRNTIYASAHQQRTTSTNGPFYWQRNVIINNSSDPDKIDKDYIEAPERLVIENNLTGVTADGIVDAQGNLTPAYAEFIGTHGHQLA
jgi:hypothetical protein